LVWVTSNMTPAATAKAASAIHSDSDILEPLVRSRHAATHAQRGRHRKTRRSRGGGIPPTAGKIGDVVVDGQRRRAGPRRIVRRPADFRRSSASRGGGSHND
jgi:hypothetical protein